MEEEREQHKRWMEEAYQEAKQGYEEGGIPIGSVLVLEDEDRLVGRGRNLRVQKSSSILHGEMTCLENAGRLTAKDYSRSTLYTTLSPCPMCTGAILLYKIPRVVIGENETFLGSEALLEQNGVKLFRLNDEKCKELMKRFIAEKPELWNEDIGV